MASYSKKGQKYKTKKLKIIIDTGTTSCYTKKGMLNYEILPYIDNI